MNQDKARDFWKTLLGDTRQLCAVLDAPPRGPTLQADIQRIGGIVQTMLDAAADIDPLLTVEADHLPINDGAVLRIAISCNHDPDGIEAVQALVAAASAMPPRIQVCSFSQPLPRELAGELSVLEMFGQEVAIQQVRFLAEPSATAPGSFDIACFVPSSAMMDMDPKGVPGELLTRVSSIGIAVTQQQPPEAVQAWDLTDTIGSALRH